MQELPIRLVLVAALVYSTAIVPWILLLILTNTKTCEKWVWRTVVICTLVGLQTEIHSMVLINCPDLCCRVGGLV